MPGKAYNKIIISGGNRWTCWCSKRLTFRWSVQLRLLRSCYWYASSVVHIPWPRARAHVNSVNSVFHSLNKEKNIFKYLQVSSIWYRLLPSQFPLSFALFIRIFHLCAKLFLLLFDTFSFMLNDTIVWSHLQGATVLPHSLYHQGYATADIRSRFIDRQLSKSHPQLLTTHRALRSNSS